MTALDPSEWLDGYLRRVHGVVIDPAISFGRPVLANTGIPTEVVAERFLAGEAADVLAEDYGIETVAVEDAVRYEIKIRASRVDPELGIELKELVRAVMVDTLDHASEIADEALKGLLHPHGVEEVIERLLAERKALLTR